MTHPNIRRRGVHLAIGLCAVVLTEVGRYFYRPFIYGRDLYDFHVADTLGNSLGTVATVFVMLAIFGGDRKADDRVVFCVTIGTVLYELASPLLGKPVDPWDVAATLLAGGLSWLLVRGMYRTERDVVVNQA